MHCLPLYFLCKSFYKLFMHLFSESPFLTALVGNIAFSLELLAVAIISLSILAALVRFLVAFLGKHDAEICINDFKQIVGSSVQLALELLIAADIINTVVLDATIQNVLVLGLLVLIRTFLSWTLMLETEGYWPWKKKAARKKDHEIT